jgi:hypothetical protein
MSIDSTPLARQVLIRHLVNLATFIDQKNLSLPLAAEVAKEGLSAETPLPSSHPQAQISRIKQILRK